MFFDDRPGNTGIVKAIIEFEDTLQETWDALFMVIRREELFLDANNNSKWYIYIIFDNKKFLAARIVQRSVTGKKRPSKALKDYEPCPKKVKARPALTDGIPRRAPGR